MSRHPPRPAVQAVAARVFATLERFLHVEAVSGIVLLLAAATAMLWANSSLAPTYAALWHAPVVLGLGNGLMTIFFLVVGLEIRRELHEGALADRRAATLPLAAALGGVAVPALIYVAIARQPQLTTGWRYLRPQISHSRSVFWRCSGARFPHQFVCCCSRSR